MAKTSVSHPLRVDFVQVRGRGRLGMTLCPGKKKERAISGAWDRDLSADLEALKEWGTAVLVSLMEDHEFERLSVSGLGERAEALGLEWHHLPICDGDVPDSRFESRWVYSGIRLRRHLERGRDVVLHCDGGLGRTGTIAARLLVDLGAKTEDAIREVRAARARTIETARQEEYVRKCKPPRADRDRELGCLLGGAVGDGLGYNVEFQSLERIHSRFGPGGIRSPVYDQGHLIVSDDTQMTMFTLEGLLRWPARGEPDVLTEELRKA